MEAHSAYMGVGSHLKMKLSILLIYLFPLVAFGQVKYTNDSLIVTDDGLTSNPFNFGSDPITEIRNRFNPKYTIQTFFNRHVEDVVDTVFTFYINNSSVDIYKVDSENFILSAHILSENITSKHGIKVGMTKSEFAKKFKDYELTTIPDYVKLASSTLEESFEIIFKEDRIASIKFTGYVD